MPSGSLACRPPRCSSPRPKHTCRSEGCHRATQTRLRSSRRHPALWLGGCRQLRPWRATSSSLCCDEVRTPCRCRCRCRLTLRGLAGCGSGCVLYLRCTFYLELPSRVWGVGGETAFCFIALVIGLRSSDELPVLLPLAYPYGFLLPCLNTESRKRFTAYRTSVLHT